MGLQESGRPRGGRSSARSDCQCYRRGVPPEGAVKAYQRINISGFQLLAPGSVLATASCSQALDQKSFLDIVRYSARKAGVRLQLLHRGSQPPDHPVLDAMPETEYLSFFIFRALPD